MQEWEMREALTDARQKITEQASLLERLTTTPLAYATVVATGERVIDSASSKAIKKGAKIRVIDRDSHLDGKMGVIREIDQSDNYISVKFDGGENDWIAPGGFEVIEIDPTAFVVVIHDGKVIELEMPDMDVKPGDTVKVSMETMQIVDVATVESPGEIAIVRRLLELMSEVDYQGSTRAVYNGRCTSLEKGDRVILDPSGSVIVRNLGKEDERFSFTTETNISWNDIGGLAQAKTQMIEAIELPHRHADLYRFYGKKPIKGVLLYGPPGCGKTMLGKATATSLAELYGGTKASNGFFYIKGPEILDKFVGVAEATIRQIFERTRKHKQENGYPAVVFIDEADAILGKRGMGISSDIERTIVPMFLTEMDGLEDSGAVIILATNRPDVLDPAVVRDGRIDRKIKVGRPTCESATDIFGLYLQSVPFHNGCTVQELSEIGSAELFSDERVLYHLQLKDGGTLDFTLGQVCNGGMIAGIVDQATSIALHRDIESGQSEGLRQVDLTMAVDNVYHQNRDLNHTDEIAEFVHDFRDDVVGVRRLRQAVA